MPGERHLHDEEQHRRHPGDEQQEVIRIAELAEDVLDARQRLRQVDLQRVGAPIVRDEPGAERNRDEEDEDVLLSKKSPEHLGVAAR